MTFHPGAGNSQKRRKVPLSHEAWGGFNSNAVIEAAKQCIKPESVASTSLDISEGRAQQSGASQSVEGVSSVSVRSTAEISYKMSCSKSAQEKSAGASKPAQGCCAAAQYHARPYEGFFHSHADSAASKSYVAKGSSWPASSGGDVSAQQVLNLLLGRDGSKVGPTSAVLPSSQAAAAQVSSTVLAALMEPGAKVAADASQQCSEATATAPPVRSSNTEGTTFHGKSSDATHTGKWSVSRNEQDRGHSSGMGRASDSYKFLALLAGK